MVMLFCLGDGGDDDGKRDGTLLESSVQVLTLHNEFQGCLPKVYVKSTLQPLGTVVRRVHHSDRLCDTSQRRITGRGLPFSVLPRSRLRACEFGEPRAPELPSLEALRGNALAQRPGCNRGLLPVAQGSRGTQVSAQELPTPHQPFRRDPEAALESSWVLRQRRLQGRAYLPVRQHDPGHHVVAQEMGCKGVEPFPRVKVLGSIVVQLCGVFACAWSGPCPVNCPSPGSHGEVCTG